DLFTDLPLAEQRIARNNLAFQYQRPQQGQDRFRFVRGGIDFGLRQGQPEPVTERGEQMHGGELGPLAATKGLAIARHRLPPRGGGGVRKAVVKPLLQDRLKANHVEATEDAVERSDTGSPAAAKAEPISQVVGMVAAELSDGVKALAAAEHGTDGQGEDGLQRVAFAK